MHRRARPRRCSDWQRWWSVRPPPCRATGSCPRGRACRGTESVASRRSPRPSRSCARTRSGRGPGRRRCTPACASSIRSGCTRWRSRWLRPPCTPGSGRPAYRRRSHRTRAWRRCRSSALVRSSVKRRRRHVAHVCGADAAEDLLLLGLAHDVHQRHAVVQADALQHLTEVRCRGGVNEGRVALPSSSSRPCRAPSSG